MSRIVSLVFLVIGVCFGIFSKSITEVMMWLVGGLYGGYVLANVLKMVLVAVQRLRLFLGHDDGHSQRDARARIAVLPRLRQNDFRSPALRTRFICFPRACISVIGCIAGTLLTNRKMTKS